MPPPPSLLRFCGNGCLMGAAVRCALRPPLDTVARSKSMFNAVGIIARDYTGRRNVNDNVSTFATYSVTAIVDRRPEC